MAKKSGKPMKTGKKLRAGKLQRKASTLKVSLMRAPTLPADGSQGGNTSGGW